MSNSETPLVSIIIPTYNSEKTLSICLESIKRQTYKNIEIIVVDNYSIDKTLEIARNYGAKIVRTHGERARAKNIGLRHARGKYVLFVDSDMELTPTVVEECVKLAESSPEIAGIIIPERSVGNNYWAKVRDFERSFYANTPIESPRFFRRDLTILAGGFDEDLVFYEEATLPYKLERLGYKVRVRVNSPILHHENDFSIRNWIRKKYYYGKSMKIFIKRYKIEMLIKPANRIAIFFFQPRFWKTPHLAVGVLILKSLEYIATVLGAHLT